MTKSEINKRSVKRKKKEKKEMQNSGNKES